MVETDETLVSRCIHDDRAAFEEMVRRTSRGLFSRFYLETGDTSRAEDLTQETYLLAWRKIKTLSDPRLFRGWLFSIGHTALLQQVRNEKRKKRHGVRAGNEVLDGLQDRANPPPDTAADLREMREKAMATLRSLPEEYRLPLTLRYITGADYETITRELAITNGSLRGLLGRGMALLRERFHAPTLSKK